MTTVAPRPEIVRADNPTQEALDATPPERKER